MKVRRQDSMTAKNAFHTIIFRIHLARDFIKELTQNYNIKPCQCDKTLLCTAYDPCSSLRGDRWEKAGPFFDPHFEHEGRGDRSW